MKSLFFFSSCILFIYSSCTIPAKSKDLENWEHKTEKEAYLDQIEQNEFYSGVKQDTVFFNLSFGMPVCEVKKQLHNLEKEEIVSDLKTSNNVLAVNFGMNYNKYTNFGRAYCFFENNKLSEMQIDTTSQLKMNMINLFVQKYGDWNYSADIDGNHEYHWINGNRHLSITQLGESKNLLIIYKDTTSKIKETNSTLLKRLHIKESTES